MLPADNDFCPCGSGKEYASCCGSLVLKPGARASYAAGGAAITDVSVTIPAISRSCGTCTACCDGWLKATIRGHEMKPGTPCHFRGKGCCTIYDERPADPCRGFVCGWLAPGSPFPDTFRPDKLGIIIKAESWRTRRVYVLHYAGRDPDESVLAAMREISNTTGACIRFVLNGRPVYFGPVEFQQEMEARAQQAGQTR
jgi:hypothetical protein